MVAVSSLSMNFLVIRISVQFKTLCARKRDSVSVKVADFGRIVYGSFLM